MIVSKEIYKPYSWMRQLFLRGPMVLIRGVKSEKRVLSSGPGSYPALVDKGSKCTTCGVCPEVCPTDCLKVEGEGHPVVFEFQETACIQCGVCVGICPEKALTWETVSTVSSDNSWRSLMS